MPVGPLLRDFGKLRFLPPSNQGETDAQGGVDSGDSEQYLSPEDCLESCAGRSGGKKAYRETPVAASGK